MHTYVELTLIKDGEISPYFIWSKLYTQLHLAFVEQKDTNGQVPYGVSFPEYRIDSSKGKAIGLLGNKVRVFANDDAELEQLNLGKWLERLTDYVHIKSPKRVETVKDHITVSRHHAQPSLEGLARRYASRHNVHVDEALKRLDGFKRKPECYPYIQISSLSDGHRFYLHIHQQTVNEERSGKFSTYGLSAISTVPHW